MKTGIIQIIVIGLLIFNSDCKPELKIDPLNYESKTLVECMLYPGEVPKLFLYRSTPFIGVEINEEEEFIKNAIVTISGNGSIDTLSNSSELDMYNCNNNFFYKGNLEIQIGVTYTLNIEIDEDKLEVSTSTDLKAVEIDSVYYAIEFLDIFSETQGLVLSFTDLESEVNFYRMQLTHSLNKSSSLVPVDCAKGKHFFAKEVSKSIYSDQGADGEKALIIMEPQVEYETGDTVYISLETLDPVSAGFYAQLEKQDASIKNPFVEHVFLENKFNNDSFIGIFGAVNVSNPVLFVFPEL